MKNARIHLIYLAIIGFLAYYHYWTKTETANQNAQSIEQFEKILKPNERVANYLSSILYDNIAVQSKAYNNLENRNRTEKATFLVDKSQNLVEWIEWIKADTNEHKPFIEQKIQNLKDSLHAFQSVLEVIKNEEFLESCITKKTLNDTAFWQKFKMLSRKEQILQLSIIQNQIRMDRIAFLNYYLGLTSGRNISCSFGYKIAIAPKKLDLVEGETFEANIFLVDHVDSLDNEITFIVNNRVLKTENESALFVDSNLSVGEKVVKAEVRVRNRFIGQIANGLNEFQYRVFPKCSRDCK